MNKHPRPKTTVKKLTRHDSRPKNTSIKILKPENRSIKTSTPEIGNMETPGLCATTELMSEK